LNRASGSISSHYQRPLKLGARFSMNADTPSA
jgi:hypothetical protein